MDTARLFLALWPDPAVRAQLAARRDAWRWPRGATAVHDAKLHLTLHFLGSVARARLPELPDALAVDVAPFRLEIGPAVAWAHGLAVLEPSSVSPELPALHARLSDAVDALGLPLEARAYWPHVTMARRAGGAGLPPQAETIIWDVRGYALVESRPGDGGYSVLRAYS